MHFLRSKKSKNGHMAIKVDLAKTYDKVERKVLIYLLHNLGFHTLDSFSIVFYHFLFLNFTEWLPI